MIEDGRWLRVECIENIDMIAHGYTDEYVPGLGSTHNIQQTHMVICDASGTSITGTELTFPRDSNGPCVHVTRLLVRSVGERPKQDSLCTSDILIHLRHPVPNPTQVPSSSCVSSFEVSLVFKVQVFGE